VALEFVRPHSRRLRVSPLNEAPSKSRHDCDDPRGE
jgi:hypothetical protein